MVLKGLIIFKRSWHFRGERYAVPNEMRNELLSCEVKWKYAEFNLVG